MLFPRLCSVIFFRSRSHYGALAVFSRLNHQRGTEILRIDNSTTRKKVRYIQPLFNDNNQYWGFRSSALARKRLNVKYQENQQVRTGSKIEYSDVHIEIVNIPLHSRSLTHPQIAIFPKQSDIFQCLPPYQCPKSKDQLSKSQKIYPNVSSPKIIPQNTWLRTVHPLNSKIPKKNK